MAELAVAPLALKTELCAVLLSCWGPPRPSGTLCSVCHIPVCSAAPGRAAPCAPLPIPAAGAAPWQDGLRDAPPTCRAPCCALCPCAHLSGCLLRLTALCKQIILGRWGGFGAVPPSTPHLPLSLPGPRMAVLCCSRSPGCVQSINCYCCNNCSVSQEMPERAEKIERSVRQRGRR